MPFLRRIPIRFTANERHFPPILIQNILYQKPARSAIPPPRKKRKKHPDLPECFSHRPAAMPQQVGQAHRSAPHKIPHKSPALPDFYTAARAAAARPPLPCRGEGGIVFGFSGTENVSRGDSVPPWTSRQRIKFVIVRCPVSGGSMPALSMTLSIHAMLRPSFSMTSTPSVSCMASPFSAP